MLLKQFIDLYHQLYLATTQLNIIVINTICKDIINSWKRQTKKELDKSSIQIILYLFEEYDTTYTNQIKQKEVSAIIKRFYSKFNLHYYPQLFIGDSDISYSFYKLLFIIGNLSNLPYNIYTIIDDFINNKISICVHCNKLMTLHQSSNCYQDSQGEAICDFTLQKAGDKILHCNSNKSKHHQYGFDIDVSYSREYFEDLLNRRLENRLFTLLNDEPSLPQYHHHQLTIKSNLTTRYQEIINKIVPNTIIYYNGLRMDLSNHWSMGIKTTVLLRNKLENYKRIIKMEHNWKPIIETQLQRVDTIANDIILLNQILEIKTNIFATKYEKTQIIKKYRQDFTLFSTNVKKQLENTNQLNGLLLDLEINTSSLNDTILDNYYDKIDGAFNNFYIGIEVLELCTPLDSLIPIIKVDNFGLDNCGICLENDNHQEISQIEKCGHCFHTNCVKRWLVQNNSCPICRGN